SATRAVSDDCCVMVAYLSWPERVESSAIDGHAPNLSATPGFALTLATTSAYTAFALVGNARKERATTGSSRSDIQRFAGRCKALAGSNSSASRESEQSSSRRSPSVIGESSGSRMRSLLRSFGAVAQLGEH